MRCEAGSSTLGSVSVTFALMILVSVEIQVESSLTSPNEDLLIECNIQYVPNGWNEIKLVSADINIGIIAVGYSNRTTKKDSNSYQLTLEFGENNVSISLLFPNTTHHCFARNNYTCVLHNNGNVFVEKTEYVSIPEMEMNDSLTKPGEEITITCNVRYAPSGWDNFSIVSIDNNDVHVIAYSNGTVVKGNTSYTAGIQHNNEDMTLKVQFPNTTTHCTARGSYLCTLTDDGVIIINGTSNVIITDLATNLVLDGNNTVQEGERYAMTCSGRLASKGGELYLHVRSGIDSDFVRATQVPSITINNDDDTCYQSIKKTYDFFAETAQNGTEFKCVATNDKLSSYQSSSSIDMIVDFADFSTDFHLQNTSWTPAYNDTNSPEFISLAGQIENETNYVYGKSDLRENFQKAKVTQINDNNVVSTTLTAADIVKAFVDTLALVADDLPNSSIGQVDTSSITGEVIITDPTENYDCNSKTDVVFLLDASGSIGSFNFGTMKYFIQNFTANVRLGPNDIQIGVTKFSSSPSNEFWLNEHYGVLTLNPAIEDINYTGGGTRIAAGLEYVLNNSLKVANGARQDSEKVVILMTDGKSSDDPAAVATTMRNAGVLVACVGIGNGIDMNQLNDIAYNSSYIFFASNFNVLTQIKDTVKSSSCEFDNNTKK
ncbi:uncharacterized protein LOC132563324 [Ylistrum balloti]|uniref:uncharacterized protein LOC132563324 n=1 Tax=Ylistrum balloti TaxID=509963 RepID=UPI002905C3DC|nr:uncharacterized protein LOC132563324 [Ylistrum balloti]